MSRPVLTLVLLGIAWAHAGCAHEEASPVVENAINQDDDVGTRLLLLEIPFGDDVHVRERERAAAWLVAHVDRAWPRILIRPLLESDVVTEVARSPNSLRSRRESLRRRVVGHLTAFGDLSYEHHVP